MILKILALWFSYDREGFIEYILYRAMSWFTCQILCLEW
jgi:hypothetical protein